LRLTEYAGGVFATSNAAAPTDMLGDMQITCVLLTQSANEVVELKLQDK
jgi:hypothetical protein